MMIATALCRGQKFNRKIPRFGLLTVFAAAALLAADATSCEGQ